MVVLQTNFRTEDSVLLPVILVYSFLQYMMMAKMGHIKERLDVCFVTYRIAGKFGGH